MPPSHALCEYCNKNPVTPTDSGICPDCLDEYVDYLDSFVEFEDDEFDEFIDP